MSTAATWPIGVAAALAGTLSGTVGKQLIRYSESKKTEGTSEGTAASRFALSTGLFLNTVPGPVLDIAAHAFAPQSLIAPFGGLDVVWNMLLAPFSLGEKLTFRRGLSAAIIFGGTALSVFTSEHAGQAYTPEVLQGLLLSKRAGAYAFVFALWMLLNFQVLMPSPKGSLQRGFSLGAVAGTVAGNMFCVKALVELVKTAAEMGSLAPFLHPLSWAIVAGAVFFAVSNVWYMTKGLQEYEALFMVTIYEGSLVTSSALSGLIILGERDQESPERIAAYLACIGSVIFGMMLLVSGENMTKVSDRQKDE